MALLEVKVEESRCEANNCVLLLTFTAGGGRWKGKEGRGTLLNETGRLVKCKGGFNFFDTKRSQRRNISA